MANPIGKPWTFKGVTDVTDCTTAEEVIANAKLNFDVRKCPISIDMPALDADIEAEIEAGGPIGLEHGFCYGGREYRQFRNVYATYRTDNNIPLGIVRDRYEVVQNRDAFSFFDSAIGKNRAIWQTAGCFDDGKRIFVSAKLPQDITINGHDKIENYLVFMNSHDGSSGVSIMLTPIRIICQNMIPAAKTKANQFIKFRHTESVHRNLDIANDILGIASNQIAVAEEFYQNLAKSSLSDIDAMRYIASVYLTHDEFASFNNDNEFMAMFNEVYGSAKQISTRKKNIMIKTYDYYHTGFGQNELEGTVYGAFNAITGYYSNIANLRGEKRFDSLLLGTASNVMHKALEVAENFAA